MLRTIADHMKRMISPGSAPSKASLPDTISLREMVRRLALIPHWEDRITFARNFHYETSLGCWTRSPVSPSATYERFDISHQKIHYGCGTNIIDGWLNVDLYGSSTSGYKRVDLLEKHPFEDNSVRFGFAEDILEHFSQAESIFFLSEVHRTLTPGGVVRLSYPGLEGVLNRHYAPTSESRIREGELDAYAYWGHIHFYGKDEMRLVATHLGFTSIRFVEFGKSDCLELCNLDTRSDQIGLNSYIELTK